MLFSEAMKLGATMAPQAFGALKDASGGTCAFGSVFEAAGLALATPTENIPDDLSRFPLTILISARIAQYYRNCPACHYHAYGDFMIMHLNDVHRWTREAIADWIVAARVDFEVTPEPVIEQPEFAEALAAS